MVTQVEFTIKAYSIKEMYIFYNVTYKTFIAWLKRVDNLGNYTGKKYTPAQVQKIVDHLGYP